MCSRNGNRSVSIPKRFAALLLAVPVVFLLEGTSMAASVRSHPRTLHASEIIQPPLMLEDVLDLLGEGVSSNLIAREVRGSGTSFRPTVDILLKLKRAGADDSVLEAIMDANESPMRGEENPPPRDRESSRIFSAHDSHGQRVMVLTNLDDWGRRIGGEVANPKPPSVVSSSEPSLPAAPRRHLRLRSGADDGGYDAVESSGGGQQSPVTVIVNQPPPSVTSGCGAPTACGMGYNGIGYGGVVAYGGIVGGFKYPDKLWFLGYAPPSPPRIDPHELHLAHR